MEKKIFEIDADELEIFLTAVANDVGISRKEMDSWFGDYFTEIKSREEKSDE